MSWQKHIKVKSCIQACYAYMNIECIFIFLSLHVEMENKLDAVIEDHDKKMKEERESYDKNLTNCTNTLKEQESACIRMLNGTCNCNSTGSIHTIDGSFIIVLLLTTVYIMIL